jgi:hypothetical protein
MQFSEYTVYRVSFAILAVSLWILGLGAISGGGFYDRFYSRYWDFGEHHVALGVVFLGLGIWSAYGAVRKTPPSQS